MSPARTLSTNRRRRQARRAARWGVACLAWGLLSGSLAVTAATALAAPSPAVRAAAPSPAAAAAATPAGTTAAQLPQLSFDVQAEAMLRYFFHPRLVLGQAERIGLTPEQRERIEGFVHASQQDYRRQRFELANAWTLLAALAVEQPVNEERILEQLDRVLEIERTIKRSQLLMLVRVKNVLNSEQLVLLDEIRRRQLEARRGRQQPPRPEDRPR